MKFKEPFLMDHRAKQFKSLRVDESHRRVARAVTVCSSIVVILNTERIGHPTGKGHGLYSTA